MGKGILFTVLATLFAVTMAVNESARVRAEGDLIQAERQKEALAREVARSALAIVASRIEDEQVKHPQKSAQFLIERVTEGTGKLQGEIDEGRYIAQLYLLGDQTIAVNVTGYYARHAHTIRVLRTLDATLKGEQVDPDPKVTIERVDPSLCTAVFVRRLVPKNNNGMGNNPYGCDPSNPAHGKECELREDIELRGGGNRYKLSEPVMILGPGYYAPGTEVAIPFATGEGERLDFIIAIGTPTLCSTWNGEELSPWSSAFTKTISSYVFEGNGKLLDAIENMAVLIEESDTFDNVWRLSFETDNFTTAQLEDVKRYGYGQHWSLKKGSVWGNRNGHYSYGGDGWQRDWRGFRVLDDRNTEQPDFSDFSLICRRK